MPTPITLMSLRTTPSLFVLQYRNTSHAAAKRRPMPPPVLSLQVRSEQELDQGPQSEIVGLSADHGWKLVSRSRQHKPLT